MCWEGVNYNQVLRSIDAAQPSLNRNVTGLNVGTRLKALGATDYVRIRWYGRAKQQRLAYGARLSHRSTVVQHRACTCALAANFASGGKKDGGRWRYHRDDKDIMSMMSKPPLRHHTKYDINMIFMRSCTRPI